MADETISKLPILTKKCSQKKEAPTGVFNWSNWDLKKSFVSDMGIINVVQKFIKD